jgi:hypothetical protein
MLPELPLVALPDWIVTAPVLPDVVLAPLLKLTFPEFEVAPLTSPLVNNVATESVLAADWLNVPKLPPPICKLPLACTRSISAVEAPGEYISR